MTSFELTASRPPSLIGSHLVPSRSTSSRCGFLSPSQFPFIVYSHGSSVPAECSARGKYHHDSSVIADNLCTPCTSEYISTQFLHRFARIYSSSASWHQDPDTFSQRHKLNEHFISSSYQSTDHFIMIVHYYSIDPDAINYFSISSYGKLITCVYSLTS